MRIQPKTTTRPAQLETVARPAEAIEARSEAPAQPSIADPVEGFGYGTPSAPVPLGAPGSACGNGALGFFGAHQSLGLSLSELPKGIRAQVQEHIERRNTLEAMSMSPKTYAFQKAEETETGFDITLRVSSYTGAELDPETVSYDKHPVPLHAPVSVGEKISSLDALPTGVRAAALEKIEKTNALMGMSMSPVVYTFADATPRSDGSWEIGVDGKDWMGREAGATLKLSAGEVA